MENNDMNYLFAVKNVETEEMDVLASNECAYPGYLVSYNMDEKEHFGIVMASCFAGANTELSELIGIVGVKFPHVNVIYCPMMRLGEE